MFKATELLFFAIVVLGQAKQRHLTCSLHYKLLAFDDLFWKIVKLEENAGKPLSFRAAGVWTAPMTRISESELPIAGWDASNLHTALNEMMARCEREAREICEEIHGPDDNLRVIERLHARSKDQYPNSSGNIWRERLLTSLLKKDYSDSAAIVRDRMNGHEFGGFQLGKKSFYELAGEYIQSIESPL